LGNSITEDHHLYSSHVHKTVKGKTEAAKHMKEHGHKLHPLETTTEKIEHCGHKAIHHGTFVGGPEKKHGRFMTVWTKEADGKWKASHHVMKVHHDESATSAPLHH